MKLACRSSALVAASLSASGPSRRKITRTSTSIWAIPARLSAPIAQRYSVSTRAWARMKLIRQIVLTVIWTEFEEVASPPCACSSDFGLAGWLFIPWRVAAARRAGSCPSWAAADSCLGNSVWQLRFARIGWRRRRRAASQLPGQRRQQPDRNTAVSGKHDFTDAGDRPRQAIVSPA